MSDLKVEVCSPKLEAKANEIVRDLKREDLSAEFEIGLNDALKVLAKPLDSDPARPSEPVTDLKNEFCCETLEAEPTEAPK